MLSGWGFRLQSQRSLCVSLQIARHHVFVLLAGLSVFANSGLKAGRQLRKRFGDFLILRNVRWTSFDEFVTLGPSPVFLLVGLGVLAHRGPKAGRTTRKCYGAFQILRANRGLKAGRKTRKRFGDFPTLCKIRWDSFDEFVSFWPAIVCSIGGLGALANRGPKAGRKTRKRFWDFPHRQPWCLEFVGLFLR